MKKYTLQNKIRTTYILIFAIVFVATMVLVCAISNKAYWDKSWELCEQLVRANLNILDSQTIEVEKSQQMIAQNDKVMEFVSYHNRQEKDYTFELIYRRKLDEIFNMISERSEINAAYIIDKEGNFIYFYKESPQIGYNMREEEWYRSLVDGITMNSCYVSGIHDSSYLLNKEKQQCVSIVRAIQCKSRYFFWPDAYLVCDLSPDAIITNQAEDNTLSFALLDKNDYLYYENENLLTERERAELIANAAKEDGFASELHENLFTSNMIVGEKSQYFEWTVIAVKNMDEINHMTKSLIAIFSAATLFMTAVTAVLSRKVSQSMLLPMNQLIEECNQVSRGARSIPFSEKPSKEIAFLSDTIEGMIANITELSDRVLEEEKKLSSERLRVLQHQINPHFLNNVLQTMKGMAVAGENDKISRMATLLGHILAYSVYKPYENVELKTELEYLKHYIELQNIRFDNKILFAVEYDERSQHVFIPKLTLQPLVENAIEHGLKGGEKLIINISTEIEAPLVNIIISDNGAGMDREELETLQQKLAAGTAYKEKSSIGLLNVNERLQRMFGEKYSMCVHSRKNSGTTVIINIPKGE